METKNLFNPISTTVLIIVSAILAILFYVNYLDIKLFIGLVVITILITSSIKIPCLPFIAITYTLHPVCLKLRILIRIINNYYSLVLVLPSRYYYYRMKIRNYIPSRESVSNIPAPCASSFN